MSASLGHSTCMLSTDGNTRFRESRRANSTLRSHRLEEVVHELYNVRGEISAGFPKRLKDMFALTRECPQ